MANQQSTGFVHVHRAVKQYHEESTVTLSPEHLKHDDNNLLTQLTTALNENASLQLQLSNASNDIDSLTAENNSLKQQLAAAVSTTKSALKRKLEMVTTELEAVKKELEEQRRKNGSSTPLSSTPEKAEEDVTTQPSIAATPPPKASTPKKSVGFSHFADSTEEPKKKATKKKATFSLPKVGFAEPSSPKSPRSPNKKKAAAEDKLEENTAQAADESYGMINNPMVRQLRTQSAPFGMVVSWEKGPTVSTDISAEVIQKKSQQARLSPKSPNTPPGGKPRSALKRRPSFEAKCVSFSAAPTPLPQKRSTSEDDVQTKSKVPSPVASERVGRPRGNSTSTRSRSRSNSRSRLSDPDATPAEMERIDSYLKEKWENLETPDHITIVCDLDGTMLPAPRKENGIVKHPRLSDGPACTPLVQLLEQGAAVIGVTGSRLTMHRLRFWDELPLQARKEGRVKLFCETGSELYLGDPKDGSPIEDETYLPLPAHEMRYLTAKTVDKIVEAIRAGLRRWFKDLYASPNLLEKGHFLLGLAERFKDEDAPVTHDSSITPRIEVRGDLENDKVVGLMIAGVPIEFGEEYIGSALTPFKQEVSGMPTGRLCYDCLVPGLSKELVLKYLLRAGIVNRNSTIVVADSPSGNDEGLTRCHEEGLPFFSVCKDISRVPLHLRRWHVGGNELGSAALLRRLVEDASQRIPGTFDLHKAESLAEAARIELISIQTRSRSNSRSRSISPARTQPARPSVPRAVSCVSSVTKSSAVMDTTTQISGDAQNNPLEEGLSADDGPEVSLLKGKKDSWSSSEVPDSLEQQLASSGRSKGESDAMRPLRTGFASSTTTTTVRKTSPRPPVAGDDQTQTQTTSNTTSAFFSSLSSFGRTPPKQGNGNQASKGELLATTKPKIQLEFTQPGPCR